MTRAKFISPDDELNFSPPRVRSADHPMRQLSGFSVEHVSLPEERFEYRVVGNSHYLAYHDIELEDGEVSLASGQRSQARSLVDRLTFVPQGCAVTGWSDPKKRHNSFTALYFDASQLTDELANGNEAASSRPLLYAREEALGVTMQKIAKAIAISTSAVHLESLCIVAVSELLQIRDMPPAARLSASQLDRLLQYVEANLADDLSVEDMAKVLGISRFHFSRLFKATTSESPYHFVLGRRVDRAKQLLRFTQLSREDIASTCGFRTLSQFEEAFRRIVGARPFSYRTSAWDPDR